MIQANLLLRYKRKPMILLLSKGSKGAVPDNSLDLTDAAVEHSGIIKFAMSITTKDTKTIYLSGQTAQESSEWVSALKEATGRSQRPVITPMPSTTTINNVIEKTTTPTRPSYFVPVVDQSPPAPQYAKNGSNIIYPFNPVSAPNGANPPMTYGQPPPPQPYIHHGQTQYKNPAPVQTHHMAQPQQPMASHFAYNGVFGPSYYQQQPQQQQQHGQQQQYYPQHPQQQQQQQPTYQQPPPPPARPLSNGTLQHSHSYPSEYSQDPQQQQYDQGQQQSLANMHSTSFNEPYSKPSESQYADFTKYFSLSSQRL
ncbi:hypothetical protein SAMD00019534_000400 [Acytostelium subglobosum LB1]|uniref:hypothetical protein n=1 Tax=Acytostelium subglobosum LB1 TaxID=1410327 RepID=UPI000644D61D|nr:hypothetical protein SAMD00019534_000400 [Acytostelium subglobosum LB1]GAM16865.1 hypothetical protein SAMD00019534_000400 [Acytostelium subglobosum LB1]|eukprot:XP_012758927.1 hypothetical protein SAMD00019534_000400 [Acytostelium subglobosum LB1]